MLLSLLSKRSLDVDTRYHSINKKKKKIIHMKIDTKFTALGDLYVLCTLVLIFDISYEDGNTPAFLHGEKSMC